MPLARHTMYYWGVEILMTPTWHCWEARLSTVSHVAKEGQVYVVGCDNAIRLSDVPDRLAFKSLLKPDDEGWLNRGGSANVDPDGTSAAATGGRTSSGCW